MSNAIRFNLGAAPADTSKLVVRPGYLVESSGAAALVAYGLRRLSIAYTGPLFQVRRSTDGATADIASLNATYDAAALLSFVGSGNATVSKWYDQSGGGYHLTAPTTAAEAKLVTAGVIDPDGLAFDGTSGYTVTGPTPYALGAASVSTVLKVAADATAGVLLNSSNKSANTGDYNLLYTVGGGTGVGTSIKPSSSTLVTVQRAGVVDGVPHWLTMIDTGTQVTLTSNTGTNVGTYASRAAFTENALNVGAGYHSSGFTPSFKGKLQELVIYRTALTSTQHDRVQKNLKQRYSLT